MLYKCIYIYGDGDRDRDWGREEERGRDTDIATHASDINGYSLDISVNYYTLTTFQATISYILN